MSEEAVTEIDIVKYVAARKKEIDLLKSEVFLSKENTNKSLFQILPRHMRRRTMGYLRKRLPHRIRKQAVIKPPNKISKRPSRKYRRRPVNLLKEYERRKRATNEKMWLETHIWHAKRFKMSDSLYGYRLALNYNVKCKRAVFKCMKDYSCIHDESYHVCYELKGNEEDLIRGLNKLCSPQLGLTFAAKIYLSGQCEGRVDLYEENKYPFNCIGPIRFLWHPTNSKQRNLWIWSHPAIYKKVESQLITVFDLKNSQNEESDSPQTKKRKLEDLVDLNETRYESENKSIVLKSLKDKLNRFKLIGPLSTTILAGLLQTVNETETCYTKQADLWNKLKHSIKDSNELIPSQVIGLLVKDPRLLMPKKKSFNKIQQQNSKVNYFSNNLIDKELKSELLKSVLSHSTIWNEEDILKLNKNKPTTQEINRLRSNFLLPGTELNVNNFSKVPILLIQNSLNSNVHSIQNGNMFSGWDIIVPRTWGLSFWLPLVHLGARAIAQTELNYLLFESGNLQFPFEYIDTAAAKIENDKIKNDLFDKYISKPPSKRVNYLKHGILSPFYCPFEAVVNINSRINEFFVLRNRHLLDKLSKLCFNKNKQLKLDKSFTQSELDMLQQSYITVRLTGHEKGKIDKFSLLYKYCDKKEIEQDEKEKKLIANLISDYRREIVENLTNKEKENKPATLNKLIKAKFNKYALLKSEKYFERFVIELNKAGIKNIPIGFVYSSGFSLVNGKYNANAFVLTKYFVDCTQNCDKNRNLINYRAINSNCLRTAKIINFFKK